MCVDVAHVLEINFARHRDASVKKRRGQKNGQDCAHTKRQKTINFREGIKKPIKTYIF